MKSSHFILNTPIAHRGLHGGGIPENTLSAFEKAIEMGLPIEFDVHLSKDGKLFVFHDYSLKRMTGIDFPCEEKNLEELIAINILNSSEKIPSFRDVLNLVRGRVPLVIEMKCYKSEDTMAKVLMDEISGYEGEFVVQSFNPLPLVWLRRHFPDMVIGLLSGSFYDSNISYYKKILLRYLIATPMVRPDYFGLEYSYNNSLQFFLAEKIFNRSIINWTIVNEGQYQTCKTAGRNIIFEAFLPHLNGERV